MIAREPARLESPQKFAHDLENASGEAVDKQFKKMHTGATADHVQQRR